VLVELELLEESAMASLMLVEDDDWLDDDLDDADSCEASPILASADTVSPPHAPARVARRKIAAPNLSVMVRNLTSSHPGPLVQHRRTHATIRP